MMKNLMWGGLTIYVMWWLCSWWSDYDVGVGVGVGVGIDVGVKLIVCGLIDGLLLPLC